MSEAEEKVKECYSTWGETYYNDYYASTSAYPPVHRDLIRSELRSGNVKNLLDAGCGPASILRDLVDLEIDLYGFDLTPEMIQECKKVMASQGYEENHFWLGSVTREEDFSGSGETPELYDASICIGVLPHINADEDSVVFANLRKSVKKGGLVIVEARNELFSLFTSNRYSNRFFADRLIPLEEIRKEAPNEVEVILEDLSSLFQMNEPPVRKGKSNEPGYDEVVSRTHNPFTVREQFAAAGFRDVRILFYHFHALPPMLEKHNPEVFRKLSLNLEQNPEDWRGHFMASAFLVVGIAE